MIKLVKMFKSFLDIVVSLVKFVVSTITSLFNLIVNIPIYITFIITNVSFMPNIVIPFILASISLYVIFIMLGRNT